MGKSKKKITNWNEYDEALCKRGLVTFWIDDSAVEAWQCKSHHGKHGRGFQFSDTAIETALMNIPLRSPDYTSISKRSKTVQVKYKNKSDLTQLDWTLS